MTIAARTTEEWRALDRSHLHPFTNYKEFAEEGSRIITSADGVYLTDSEGHRILDGMAGLWCVNVGYGRKELAEAAYRQMQELPYYNTFFKTATPPVIELSKKLVDITPDGLNYVFYGSSGSESNDTIVRMVRHFWNLHDKPTKKTIISRTYAYHGSTMASASLGGMPAMHEVGDLPLPGFVHVMPPYWYDFGGDMDRDAFGLAAARAVEDKIKELGPDNVAAFIGEPIQGAGGVLIPPKTYWPEIQRICREYDVLLICDEVICGFGRTGNWFGAETFEIVKPDFMTLAKGITSGYVPLSAVMVGDRVADTLMAEGSEFAHGYTYSGHPVPCAVAIANIDVMESLDLVGHVKHRAAPHFAQRFKALEDHPLVGEVRTCGLLAAVELVADKAERTRFEPAGHAGATCRDFCLANDVVLRASRDTMISAPPLIIDEPEIDELVDGLAKCLDLTQAALTA